MGHRGSIMRFKCADQISRVNTIGTHFALCSLQNRKATKTHPHTHTPTHTPMLNPRRLLLLLRPCHSGASSARPMRTSASVRSALPSPSLFPSPFPFTALSVPTPLLRRSQPTRSFAAPTGATGFSPSKTGAKKAARKKESRLPDTSGRAEDKYAKAYVQMLTPFKYVEDRSPEQLAKDKERAKEYSRQCMRRERALQRQLMLRFQTKQAALEAVPEKYREACLARDWSPIPPFPPITWTPPIPGYTPPSWAV